MRRNYHRKLWGEIIKGNYEEKLSQEIMYPKIKLKRKREIRCAPLPFRGKRAENWLHNVGKSLGEGLAGAKIP